MSSFPSPRWMLQCIPCVSRYAVAACCSVLQCVAVRCSVSHAPGGIQHVTLQGAAGCCKVLQGAAAWCSALQGCKQAFQTFHVVPNLQPEIRKSASLDENTSHRINQSSTHFFSVFISHIGYYIFWPSDFHMISHSENYTNAAHTLSVLSLFSAGF